MTIYKATESSRHRELEMADSEGWKLAESYFLVKMERTPNVGHLILNLGNCQH